MKKYADKNTKDFRQIFLGEGEEKLTDELIAELVKTEGFLYEDLKIFQAMGCTYSRPRKTCLSPLMGNF